MTRNRSIQGDAIAENLIMVNQAYGLPHRPRQNYDDDADDDVDADDRLTLNLHPVENNNDHFLVSIQPPRLPVKRQPEDDLKRVSCDIVLVIDVSSSMGDAAPLPDAEDGEDKESTGLSILDLTKHAARTILETLTESDRLGIVTFSEDAKIVQKLMRMTPARKEATLRRIAGLGHESNTNLWAGIRSGLEVFGENDTDFCNVQGLFVLTDGMPNHMSPPQGYVAKLDPILTKAESESRTLPTIHTFGFGYQMRSGLMQSIAEVGNGSYSFISDAGMIGTVFVHAVANLFTTFATSARLEVEGLKDAVCRAVGFKDYESLQNARGLRLGNLQYGQGRQLLVQCRGVRTNAEITVTLSYKMPDGAAHSIQCRGTIASMSGIPRAHADYHVFRAQLCEFLSSLFPLGANGEHTYIPGDKLGDARTRLDFLITKIEACAGRKKAKRADGHIWSLLEDLKGDGPAGQVSKALETANGKDYWMKWGRHYLPSLLHAHQRQLCNTFKDPGPLMYGRDSPMFIKYRDLLDAAFDSLPAPTPSRPERVVRTYAPSGEVTGTRTIEHTAVSMKRYNSSATPCFEGNCLVKTASGTNIPVKMLKPGMLVDTPVGQRKVVAVVKTEVCNGGRLCRVGDLLVTPWHPIHFGGEWVFPNAVQDDTVPFVGYVYSVLLAPSKHPDAHAIEIGGQVCVTLGHGLVGLNKDDARAHPFFGDYRKVVLSLARLPVDKKGHVRCGGVKKAAHTGLACGFMAPATGRRTLKKFRMAGVRNKARC